MDIDRPASDPLVLGMTRPLMVFGVTYSYCVIEAMTVTVLFLVGNHLLYLLALIPLHTVGALLCRWDAHYFDILVRVARLARPVPNRSLHRCNRYVAN